jgi:hypothetical protein
MRRGRKRKYAWGERNVIKGTHMGWKGKKSEISELYIQMGQRARRVSELTSFFCLG